MELTDDLDRIYASADVITIHLPKTKDTEGLIGKEALEKMREGVRIVNTSRGGIIDEAALAEMIRVREGGRRRTRRLRRGALG